MKDKELKKITFIFCSIVIAMVLSMKLNGQSSIVSSGGNASGPGGTVSYSGGQSEYKTLTGSGGTVAEGVQQPYEISVPTGSEYQEITLSWTIFPNPVGDILKLRTGDENPDNLSYKLIDINGKLLKEDKILSPETAISFSGIRPGAYFLKVYTITDEIKVFKIIKH